MTLQRLRRRIDRIDLTLLALLNERGRLAQKAGQAKRRQGRPVFDGQREAQILRRLKAANAGPFPSGSITQIFRSILSASRKLEHPKARR